MPPTQKDSGRKKRPDGEGSLYQRHKDGCAKPVNSRGESTCKCPWVGAFVLEFRAGKPIRKRVTAKTRSGAAAKLREIRAEHEANTLPVGKSPTVEQWMNHWLSKIAARKVGPLTLENSYRQKVRDYIIPLLGHHRLDRLTAEHIEAAWDELSEVGNPTLDYEKRKPLAPNTVLQTHRILSRALKVAVQRKRLRTNPAATEGMDAPSGSKVEMTPLTLEESRKVLAAAKGKRNAARWSVALALGLRQGEALGLRWEDVNLDDGVLRVRQALQRVRGRGLVFGGLKSDAGRRDIALPAELVTQLRQHKSEQNAERIKAGSIWEDHGLVFCQENGKPIDPSRDWKSWRDLLAAAKVPKRRLHDARHAAATLMLLQGIDTRVVMQILGHSQISMTMRYQHAVDELRKDAAAKVGSALYG